MANVENLTRLINRIKNAPPETFAMDKWYTGPVRVRPVEQWPECGTVACIGGHAECIIYEDAGVTLDNLHPYYIIEWIGMSFDDGSELFLPFEYNIKDITREQALAHLCDIRDGKPVDWSRYVEPC